MVPGGVLVVVALTDAKLVIAALVGLRFTFVTSTLGLEFKIVVDFGGRPFTLHFAVYR